MYMADRIHTEEKEFNGRAAVAVSNDTVRVTVLRGGGHIAEISLFSNGVNPLWVPQWKSIEPDEYRPDIHDKTYGGSAEGRLLASIMGHSVCLDFFGDPSEEEQGKGLTVHGEAPVQNWDISTSGTALVCSADLPVSNLGYTREIRLDPGSAVVRISEKVYNRNDAVHEFGWCQHITLGKPFLKKGKTLFNMPAVWGKTYSDDFGSFLRMEPGRDFIWPTAPGKDGKNINLQIAPDEDISGDFSAQLTDDSNEQAYFTAFTQEYGTLFGYVWKREDYPWIGNWEENYSRSSPPWRGNEYCRGMEFSTSPFPEGRKNAVERGMMHGTPTYKSIGPGETASVEYAAFISDGFADFSGTHLLEYNGETVTIRNGKEQYTIE